MLENWVSLDFCQWGQENTSFPSAGLYEGGGDKGGENKIVFSCGGARLGSIGWRGMAFFRWVKKKN